VAHSQVSHVVRSDRCCLSRDDDLRGILTRDSYAVRKLDDNKEVMVLAPYLHKLVEHVHSTGDYPRLFEVSSLTPIHKKGDVMDPSNYSGLAVGGALLKLYAFLLERRLRGWGQTAACTQSRSRWFSFATRYNP
jgi:hypothetical protein